MTRILVAGAGGYIGIPLCRSLAANGHEVLGLDCFFFGEDKLDSLADHPLFTLIRADIRDFDVSLLRGIDVIMDLAGLSTDAAADIDAVLTEQINNMGAMRLAAAAKSQGVRRYIYSSSAAVYGAGEKQSLSESDDCRPQTRYARSKVQAERDLAALAGDGFEIVILRNATVFGLAPRMRFDISVNGMSLRAWRDHEIHVRGGGQQWRPLVHVNDVARAFLLAGEAESAVVSGEIFNVGNNTMNYRVSQIAQLVVDALPNVAVHYADDAPDNLSYHLCFDKIAERLGFEPTMSVAEGISEVGAALENNLVSGSDPTCYTADWYRSILQREPLIKDASTLEIEMQGDAMEQGLGRHP